jgi:YHS domain-containing protein
MIAEKGKTEHITEHGSERYYFCTEECQKEFEKAHEKYQDLAESI